MLSCGTEELNDTYAASDWIFKGKGKVIWKAIIDLVNSLSFQTLYYIWPRNTMKCAVKFHADEG